MKPAHVIILAGVTASYGHPHQGVVEAYIEATNGRVFCTNRHGTIRVYGYPDGRVCIRR